MSDETATGSTGTGDGGGPSGGGAGEQSPLQSRAAFLKNWNWQLVVRLNEGACGRGGAQHGFNRETHEEVAARWETTRLRELTLEETLAFLRQCHRDAPFLFFNGNTFADISRRLAAALLADLPPARLRQATSAVAHFVAGVLDRESMAGIVQGLMASASFSPGDRVMTLRGSARGVVVRLLANGQMVWRADGGTLELMCLPESMRREE